MNEKDQALEDLKIIKTMINRTKEAIDPAAPILILWGILVFIGNTITHFLLSDEIYHIYIGYTWIGIPVIGIILSGIMGYRIGLRRFKHGINYYASRKLALIWTILIPIGIVWSILGPYTKIFPQESLSVFWALLYSIGIYIMGIFYSKEFLFGGIVIFLGTVFSVIFYDFHCLIIGIFMGAGTTIPAVIAHKRFRKMLRETDEG
ncbi:hypothetical protein ACFL4T_00905 [candidate division KSB1 bacterium]